MSSDDRIHELEAKVAELTALVDKMSTAPIPVARPSVVIAEPDAPSTSSRRGMLKLAGAAAVGAVAAAATGALPAAALDGDPLLIGDQVQTAQTQTALIFDGTVPNAAAGIFKVVDNTVNVGNSSYPATLNGFAYGNSTSFPGRVANGIYGFSFDTAGNGVVGWANNGGIGVRARGVQRANLVLEAEGLAGALRSVAHTLGELVCDAEGNIWACTVAGTPGTWRKITGAATAGAFHALSPGRVYDSRAPQPTAGSISNGQNRTISVADKRDPTSGAVTLANFVPAGATAVTANVTVSGTVGSGFLTVNPGGTTTVDSSTINWSGPNQILANGVTLTLNATRQVTVVAGGPGSTDFLIDISGYFL